MVEPGPNVQGRYLGRVLSVKGLEEGKAFLQEIMGEIREGNIAKKNLEALGPGIVEFASSNTPIRTGRLVSNNRWRMVGNKKLVIYNETPYAFYVHNGTSKMEARPFIEIAVNMVKARFPELYIHDAKDFIRRLLAKYNRR